MKKRIRATEAVLQRLNSQLAAARQQVEHFSAANARHLAEHMKLSQAVADKNAAIAARQEEIERQKVLVKRTEEERDRLVRVVDQFLSVSIAPHNAAGSNSPADLRILRKV